MFLIQPQSNHISGNAPQCCDPAYCKGLDVELQVQELRIAEQAPGVTRHECGERTHWQVTANHPIRYEVEIVPRLLDPGNPTLARSGSQESQGSQRRLLVIDTQVHSLYAEPLHRYLRAQKIDYELEVIATQEPAKTMEAVFGVVRAMDRFGISRRSDPVIAVGGGVLTDIVGLAANLYRRSNAVRSCTHDLDGDDRRRNRCKDRSQFPESQEPPRHVLCSGCHADRRVFPSDLLTAPCAQWLSRDAENGARERCPPV